MVRPIRSFRAIVWIVGSCVILLGSLATSIYGQVPADPERGPDAEMARRIAPLIPSFRAALQGNNVDAQRATLAVLADIPPATAATENLAGLLATFLQRDLKDPEIIALGVRSFGRTYPDAPDIDKVLTRYARSEHAIVRHATAESLANAINNSSPAERSVARATYFINIATRAVPLLAILIEDNDPPTQKEALIGIQATSRVIRDLYQLDTGPVFGEGGKPKDRQARFAPLTPVVRALADAAPKLASPIKSPDSSTRRAAARTLETLALLRRTILASRGLGEPEIADPFATAWPKIKDAVEVGIKDKDPDVRLAMTEALESLGEAIEARALLRQATTDRNLFVRWAAARAIGLSAPLKPEPKASAADVAALVRLLDDSDLDVRTAAINALARFGPAAKSATPAILAAVERGDVEPRVAAIKALGAIESEPSATVPVFIKALQHKDVRLRIAAASGLVRFGPAAKEALPELQKALLDPNADLRLAAAEAILAIEQRKPREL